MVISKCWYKYKNAVRRYICHNFDQQLVTDQQFAKQKGWPPDVLICKSGFLVKAKSRIVYWSTVQMILRLALELLVPTSQFVQISKATPGSMADEVLQSWHQIWDFDQLGSRFQRLSSKNGTWSQNKRTIAVLETFCEKRNRRWSQLLSGQRFSPCVSCYCPVVAVTFIFRPRLPHPAHASWKQVKTGMWTWSKILSEEHKLFYK